MKYSLYTVHDAKAEMYQVPWVERNDHTATRAFAINVNNSDSHMFHNPGDYTLFCIGNYDDETGLIEQTLPRSIGNGINFRRPDHLVDQVADISEYMTHQAEAADA